MRKIFSRSIVKLVTILSLTSLVQAAQFHLPAGTPGLQAGLVQQNINENPVNCEHIIVPGTNCDLFFPTNGVQPTTEEAGQCSGARYNGPNNDAVTDWWVRVFGGNDAVNLSYLIPHVDTENNVFMGFDNLNHIITLPVVDNPIGFKRAFCTSFRTIAADPVGRVLLYRLLIEIRRIDRPGGNGCCGDDVVFLGSYNLNARNVCRNITINYAQEGCSFYILGHIINFKRDDTTKITTLLKVDANTLKTDIEARPSDIGLFHEMLHWFHFLRHPSKYLDNQSSKPTAFKYAMCYYYGYQSELCAWGNINAEEIATILGNPNLNQNPNPYVALIHPEAFPTIAPRIGHITIQNHGVLQYILNYYKYLHGDDLSENAYRASRGQHMRFGHVSGAINPVVWPNPPDRFQLAYRVAYDCYFQITGNAPYNWFFGPGQALNN